MQRFSIRLNDMGPSVEVKAPERPPAVLIGRPGAAGATVRW
jgi:hypothetical protein